MDQRIEEGDQEEARPGAEPGGGARLEEAAPEKLLPGADEKRQEQADADGPAASLRR